MIKKLRFQMTGNTVGPCDCTEATAKPRRIVEMVMQSFIYLWPSPKESRKAVTKL
jgi:hypothetical protein